MKKIITLLLFTTYFGLFAQEKKEGPKTKMETFVSRTGVIKKYNDYKMKNIITFSSVNETRVREIIINDEVRYFYQIMRNGKYTNSTASIEYSDLLETIKAISVLKKESEAKIETDTKPSYTENKFVTEDGFEVGYYTKKGKIKWFLTLERFGSDNTIFVRKFENIKDNFTDAKNKIEELKNKK